MQDVEVAGVVQVEGSRQGECVHPSKDGAKEVAGDVETLVAPSQLHHVAAGAGGAEQSSETVNTTAQLWFGTLTQSGCTDVSLTHLS